MRSSKWKIATSVMRKADSLCLANNKCCRKPRVDKLVQDEVGCAVSYLKRGFGSLPIIASLPKLPQSFIDVS